MAVVLQQPILLSDVTAARSLQLVQVPSDSTDPTAAVLDALIERALMLSEVERYQPPEPAASEIDARIADITRRVGSPEAMAENHGATGMTLRSSSSLPARRPPIDDLPEPAIRRIVEAV